MVTAILTIIVIWCLFYGQISSFWIFLLCITVLPLVSRHKDTKYLTIDVVAQTSRLNKMNPSLKFCMVVVLLVICVSAQTPVVGMFLMSIMFILIVCIGGLKYKDYIKLLALPVSFLMLSGLALLFEVYSQPVGVITINIFGLWFCVSKATQIRTALVISRALGAVSCLYFLSLTTPMSALIGILRRVHCPSVLIDLMYLIYRYIFILFSMYHAMQNAAKSRLGYIDYLTSIRTTGNLYFNLLARSYRQANINFDAMESRCFDKEIRFLEKTEKVTAMQIFMVVCIIVFTLIVL